MTHCDDFIDDPAAPEPLRRFLAHARAPAIQTLGRPHPPLFATVRETGRRVRVVMASRFGDVGITPDLKACHGYSERMAVDDLTDFAAAPRAQHGGDDG